MYGRCWIIRLVELNGVDPAPSLSVVFTEQYVMTLNTMSASVLVQITEDKLIWSSNIFCCGSVFFFPFCLNTCKKKKQKTFQSLILKRVEFLNVKFVFPDRCDSERLPRCGPGTFCHRQQNPEDPEVQRSGPRPAWGPVPPDQEGCGRPEAPGEKQKGTVQTDAFQSNLRVDSRTTTYLFYELVTLDCLTLLGLFNKTWTASSHICGNDFFQEGQPI